MSTPPFSRHCEDIASDGAAGWAIADAASLAMEQGEDVISLCLGDTSFDTPTRVTDAAISSLRRGRTHYSPVPGIPELRRNIAAAQARFDKQTWSGEQAVVFGGAQNALFAALMTVAGPGDEIVYFQPWYATYEAAIRAGGAVARAVDLQLNNASMKVSEAGITAAINDRTRAILLNSPNNPGGYIFSRDELMMIAKLAERHNLWIVSDEVYRSTVYNGEFVSITSLPSAKSRTIIVNSLSKSHAMTGWRVGWALGPQAASAHLENLAQCMLFGSPTFIQDAAVVALEPEGDIEMADFCSSLKRRRDLMISHLSEIPNLQFIPPDGGMFCFVDVSKTGLSGEEFAMKLFEIERLAVVPGFAFGPGMISFVRLSFSSSEEVIRGGMDRLRRFVHVLHDLG